MTRRTAISVMTTPLLARGSRTFDRDFGYALDAAAAIRAGDISSVELTTHVFGRIERFDAKVNAFVYQMRDEALAKARRIDAAVARKENLPPFAGVPIVVKEAFGVAGRPCTWGIPGLKNAIPATNADAVQRLLDSGAVLIGATNVPVELKDEQTYNDIYGTTNNPWDLTRTPGGSSGGTSAALAAGMGFLGLGTDAGGSIRGPAHCCGIFGHKPTLDIVSLRGCSPGGARSEAGFSGLISVAGPMARSTADLETAMRVLGGSTPPDSVAYSWKLPAPRHTRLRDFRVGYILEDPMTPVSSEIKPAIESAVLAVEKAGAQVQRGWPADFSLQESFSHYFILLNALGFSLASPQRQAQEKANFAAGKDDIRAAGALIDFASWQSHNLRRLALRALWQRYFEHIDVFLMPVLPVAAFPHDHSEQARRVLSTPEGPLPYLQATLSYPSVANLTGCPATAAPVGKTSTGLPVGIQILGPYLEDATPIQFAGLLAEETGGFSPPTGY